MTSTNPMPTTATRIILVDDHALFRDGLRELLCMEPDLTVVGEASNGDEAVALIEQHHPDLMLLDVGIPGDHAATTVCRALSVAPTISVIILSMFDDPQMVKELLNVGARAYLLKSVTRADLVAAIRSIRSDGKRMLLSISRESFEQVSNSELKPLSAREIEIIHLVAQAYSNVQIAHRLNITEGTVKRHLRNIFTKLGAVSRIDAVNKAMAMNLLNQDRATSYLTPRSNRSVTSAND